MDWNDLRRCSKAASAFEYRSIQENTGVISEQILSATDLNVRRAAIKALVGMNAGPIRDAGVVTALITALRDSDDCVRMLAAEVLAEQRDIRTFDPLLEALEDDYYAVRVSAMRALAATDPIRAVEPLLQRLVSVTPGVNTRTEGLELRDTTRYEREVAAELLIQLDERRACEALFAITEDLEDPFTERAALFLGKTGDRRAVIPLLRLIQNQREYTYLTGEAVRALGGIGDERAVEPLLQLMIQNPQDDIVVALGHIGDRRAAAALLAVLQIRTYNYHFAVRALGQMKAIPELLECLRHFDSSIRQHAAQTLDALQDHGEWHDTVISALQKASQDEMSYVRSAAKKALRNRGIKVPRKPQAI